MVSISGKSGMEWKVSELYRIDVKLKDVFFLESYKYQRPFLSE